MNTSMIVVKLRQNLRKRRTLTILWPPLYSFISYFLVFLYLRQSFEWENSKFELIKFNQVITAGSSTLLNHQDRVGLATTAPWRPQRQISLCAQLAIIVSMQVRHPRHVLKVSPTYPIYKEQKISGSRSWKCTHLSGTFIVQYNKGHHIVVHCSIIVTLQSNLYRD